MKKDWDFSLIYQVGQFEQDLQEVKGNIPKLSAFQGHLAEKLEEYILLDEKIGKKLYNLYTYSHMRYDLNQKDTKNFSTLKEVESIYGDYLRHSSFFSPEVIAIGYDKVKALVANSPKLQEYNFTFTKMFDQQAHILGANEERILSNFSEVENNHGSLYSSIAVSDNYDEDVTISTGETLKINNGNYRFYLGTLANQDDRRLVFESVFKYYADHKHTFASIYNGIVQNDIALMKSRNYGSTLESYLEKNKIPMSVYHSLIETTRNNTEIVKKYIDIRKKYFKIEKYHTYDRFLSFTKSDIKFDYETSYQMFMDSAKGLGEDFYKLAQEALRDGAVDVDIKDGKRTGAYSTGAYGVGPFILLNHNQNIDSAFTIAHEAGHSIHTILASKNQPFATQDYTIFVAEIASTFNEQLFLDYLIKTSNDDNFKIALIAQAIDGILGTFYRQSLFADYEYQAHQLAEKGTTISHETLSKIMKDLYEQYYNLNLDEELYKEVVWAYIPHFFFTPYYVYQYATSFSASLQIYQDVKNKKEGAFERYLGLLKSGGSDYPVNQVLAAGVDLTSPEPFLAVVSRLTELVALLEDLLSKKV